MHEEPTTSATITAHHSKNSSSQTDPGSTSSSIIQSALQSTPYTSYYCEENVYLLVQSLIDHPRILSIYACFVTNRNRTGLLFHQAASKQPRELGSYVIWDYHVFVIVKIAERNGHERLVVVDRDSKLGNEVDLVQYVEETFHPELYRQNVIDPSLESRIRIVPGRIFLENFASDRSHMLDHSACDPAKSTRNDLNVSSSSQPLSYIHPPPLYPPICGNLARQRGERHNLWTKFLDVSGDRRGFEEVGSKEEEDRSAAELYGIVLEGPEELLFKMK